MDRCKSITTIVEQKLCSACGLCVGICPVQAISLRDTEAGFLEADVDRDKCVACGRCLKVCPSDSRNTEEIFHCWPDNWFEGEAVAGYIGHAADDQQRFSGQSGGVVTGLLAWLLETGRIEAAAVNHFSEKKQRPEAILARTVEEIKQSAGSYYLQTAVLTQIKKLEDIERLAVVCTGCQSEALHFAAKNISMKKPYITIGLVCEGVYSMGMFNDLTVHEFELRKIKEFRFRDKRNGGWPGGVYIGYADGKSQKRPSGERIRLKKYYGAYRCYQCVDMNNLYADIVCGDPWFMKEEMSSDSCFNGETVVVARTERGAKILEEAAGAGILKLQKINYRRFFAYNSFDEGRVAKNCIVQMLCRKHKLPELYPHFNFLDTAIATESMQKNIRCVENDLMYAWNYCHASEKAAATVMVAKRKKQDFIKRIVKWPFASVRRAISRCIKIIIN